MSLRSVDDNIICLVAFLGVVFLSANLRAQTWRDSLDLVYDDGQGNTLPYRLFLPPGHDQPGAEFPLVVYLHRAGHIGKDNRVHVSNHIAGLIRATQGPEFTSILLAPQAPTAWWYDSVLPLTTGLLDEVEPTLNVDSDRIYLTGTSMGGFGITDLVSRYPGRFAAVVPLSAGIFATEQSSVALESEPLADADVLAKTPYWIFHAVEDTTTSVEWSRDLVAAVEAAGGSPRYTELPGGAQHASIWSGIYQDRNSELYPWMFSQTIAIPEPTTNTLLMIGFAMCLVVIRRRFDGARFLPRASTSRLTGELMSPPT